MNIFIMSGGLQRIDWTQILSEYVTTGYTVNIGSCNTPVNAVYSKTFYSGCTQLDDLLISSGSFDDGVLTLSSVSGNTITIDGFAIETEQITGGTFNGTELILITNSGTTITITGFTPVPFMKKVTDGTNIIRINESIFNPDNLLINSGDIFIVDTNASYYVLGDIINNGQIDVRGTLKIGGNLINNGSVIGSGIIE